MGTTKEDEPVTPDPYPTPTCTATHHPADDSPALAAGPPWLCSLPPGHDGGHETWVRYSFTDGRASQWALAWSWAGGPAQLTFDAA